MKYLVILLSLMTISCSQNQVKTHIGTGAGAVSGYLTCRGMLNANVELTAACVLLGGLFGSTLFYTNDMNTHTAVFVDTLNTAPGKRSHTNWGNSANGNWGSITINKSYVNDFYRCRDYESVISIEHSWPMNGISRESETGTACQEPDGRWQIIESTNS